MYQAHDSELLNQKENEADIHPLYDAVDRLLLALDKLEERVAEKAQSQEQGQLAIAQENEGLRQERENLTTAVGQLQQQYDDLHRVAATIYSKLEDSIKRLTKIIEN